MESNYDTKQKVSLMAIALATSMIILGLNACQKAETGAGKTAQAVGHMVDTSRGGIPESMPTAEAIATATGEMIDTSGEKTVIAYQAVGEPPGKPVENGVDDYHFARDALDESFDKGVDAYESNTQMMATAVNDNREKAKASSETVNTVYNQVTTTQTF